MAAMRLRFLDLLRGGYVRGYVREYMRVPCVCTFVYACCEPVLVYLKRVVEEPWGELVCVGRSASHSVVHSE